MPRLDAGSNSSMRSVFVGRESQIGIMPRPILNDHRDGRRSAAGLNLFDIRYVEPEYLFSSTYRACQ